MTGADEVAVAAMLGQVTAEEMGSETRTRCKREAVWGEMCQDMFEV